MIKSFISGTAFLIALLASFSHVQAQTVPFYIVIGQSNTGWTSATGMTSQQAATYGGAVANTEIWNPGRGAYSASWEPMSVGVNTMCENYVTTTQFGPESAFLKSLQNQKSTKRMIFKQGEGGTTLSYDWKPVAVYQGGEGPRWSQFKEWLNLAVTQANARGYKLDLRAIIWMQGEDDSKTLADANAYLSNLTNFFSAINNIWQNYVSAYSFPNTPYKKVIGRIYAPTGYPYRDIVRAAQADFCANPANNAVMINTDNYSLQDWVHYDPSGQIQFGLDIFNAAQYESSTTTTVSTGVAFTGKVFLQGAYDATTHMMTNSLNTPQILEVQAASQPYSAAGFDYNGAEKVAGPTFFPAHRNIVDWVLVELRNTSAAVVATRAAFVKQDGTIVDTNGVSPVSFAGLTRGSYYVSVRHRNHLGIRSASMLDFSSGTASYDFTTASSKSYQSQTYTSTTPVESGVWAMRGGDANSNKTVKYNGPTNDQDRIQNIGLLGSYSAIKVNVYATDDVNLDGNIKTNGPANDQNFLLNISLDGMLGTIINEQL